MSQTCRRNWKTPEYLNISDLESSFGIFTVLESIPIGMDDGDYEALAKMYQQFVKEMAENAS